MPTPASIESENFLHILTFDTVSLDWIGEWLCRYAYAAAIRRHFLESVNVQYTIVSFPEI